MAARIDVYHLNKTQAREKVKKEIKHEILSNNMNADILINF